MTYEHYCSDGKGYFQKFIKINTEFNDNEFTEFEVLRLAYEFEEMKARFPNCYGNKQ